MSKTFFVLIALFAFSESKWILSNNISTSVPRNQLQSNAIKSILYDNLDLIINQTVKKALIHDLNEIDDEKRILTQLDSTSSTIIFSIFKLKDPICDLNGDNLISGKQLICFKDIRKHFVPT